MRLPKKGRGERVNKMKKERRCIGFGKYESKCENKADGRKYGNPHWCDRCERIRRDTIHRQLLDIKASFNS